MNANVHKKRKWLSWEDFPEGFTPFPLNPTGVTLGTKKLAPGVYALLADKANVDNAGFVVGERGVLVIDAHISVSMARQIQERVREVTDKPILYLVNSCYHGDHTFGNCAFPAETLIVQHRRTAELVPYFEEEKAFLLPTVDNDSKIFAGVELRLPDVVFDNYLRIDLGGRAVELHYFGAANTPGDTITYVPEAKVAWTGNMTHGDLIVTLESDPPTYMRTIARFAENLAVDTLVPAHYPPTTAANLGRYFSYLGELNNEVMKAVAEGLSLKETQARVKLNAPYAPAPDDPRLRFFTELHSFNVQKAYQ
ncbi:MBL fold metallo-hydrolase, partial [Nitrospinota bacterium]